MNIKQTVITYMLIASSVFGLDYADLKIKESSPYVHPAAYICMIEFDREKRISQYNSKIEDLANTKDPKKKSQLAFDLIKTIGTRYIIEDLQVGLENKLFSNIDIEREENKYMTKRAYFIKESYSDAPDLVWITDKEYEFCSKILSKSDMKNLYEIRDTYTRVFLKSYKTNKFKISSETIEIFEFAIKAGISSKEDIEALK